MMNKIAIIDGNSLMNRAYYAMRNPMITKEGIFTQGIFGFINMLDKIRSDYEPTHMAIAFDLKAPTFRHKEYDAYKAGRKRMPPELAMEFPIIKDILKAMNIAIVELEGFEADDLIGTIARMGEASGLEPLIITGDKDALQLATDITKIIYTKRGVSEFEVYDKNAMLERYSLTPEQFIDLKGLMGDTSDNIPGIPGVGEKTATKLLLQFGSIENLLQHVDDIKPKGVKAKVEENAQLAVMSKRLATINTNVPLDYEIDDFLIGEPNYDEIIDLYTRLEFNRFLKKLNLKASSKQSDLGSTASENLDLITADKINKIVITDANNLKDIKFDKETVIKIFGDYNHLARPIVDGVSILSNNNYYYVNGSIFDSLAQIIGSIETSFVGHNLKKDYYTLMAYGLREFNTAYDTEVAEYVLNSGRSDYDIAVLASEYLHVTLKPEKIFRDEHSQINLLANNNEEYSQYGLELCLAIMNVRNAQKPNIDGQELDKVLYNVELPLVEVMAAMEKEGFKADREYLLNFGDTLNGEIDKLTRSIHDMAGEEFNIKSTQQLGTILFDKLGLPAGKKTKKGYSTSAEVLEKLRDKHPIINEILEYRSLTKLKSTYVDGMIPLIADDGKIHAHFNQTVTTTGRISCTEPNLQNIPVRQELGRKLRCAFIPENDNCTLVGADYSQIELRVLAHMSGDEGLIDAFARGEDIHRATAANVLGIAQDEVTSLDRSRAKAVNFGVIYGMSAFGLSSELHITRKEAEAYINTYFAKHDKIRQFMDNQVAKCKDLGYVTTLLGRRRYIKEIRATQYMVKQIGERLAMNTPIQGTAADIIKLAMIKVYGTLKEQNLKSRLILQVHDELIINTYKDEKEAVEKLLVDNMESAYEMVVALKADLNEGDNWYKLK